MLALDPNGEVARRRVARTHGRQSTEQQRAKDQGRADGAQPQDDPHAAMMAERPFRSAKRANIDEDHDRKDDRRTDGQQDRHLAHLPRFGAEDMEGRLLRIAGAKAEQ